jgi:Bacterial Ig-like domain (group 3)/Chitobiase/beta-hexosaminidase C-terminal domain/NHL repeat
MKQILCRFLAAIAIAAVVVLYPFTILSQTIALTPGTIGTIAGNGIAGEPSPGTVAAGNSIEPVYAIAVAPIINGAGGDIYFSESTNYVKVIYEGGAAAENIILANAAANNNVTEPVIGDIYLIAGNGTAVATNATTGAVSGSPGTWVLSSSAVFTAPCGLALDSYGNLFIANNGNSSGTNYYDNDVVQVVYAGNISAQGTNPAANLINLENTTVTVSALTTGTAYNGYLFNIAGTEQSDSDNAVLAWKIGRVNPHGVVVDSYENVYIAFDAGSGSYVEMVYSGAGANALNLLEKEGYTGVVAGYSYAIAGGYADQENDYGDGSVGYEGGGPGAAGTPTSAPYNVWGIGLNPTTGDLYFSDLRKVRKLTAATGIISTVVGPNSGTAPSGTSRGDGGLGNDGTDAALSAAMSTPRGVAVDAGGDVYIADSGNNAIRKLDASGYISTIAGTNTTTGAYAGDGGNATAAMLYDPYDVKLDAYGDLLIADEGNLRIREVTVNAAVAGTLGSSPTSSGSFAFGDVTNNTNSSTVAALISNVTGSPVTPTNVSIPTNFVQVAGGNAEAPDCSTSTAIPEGTTCTLALQFTPVATGLVSGQASVTANNIDTVVIPVSGVGVIGVAGTPTFSPVAGTYSTPQTVTISSATPGAQIYYTTNGTAPTTSSTAYSGPILVAAATQTVKAIAIVANYGPSAVGSAAYTISHPAAATPTFNPVAGAYSSAQTVTISSTTASAKIYYTTNGATPTTSSTLYSAPISVTPPETVEAIATATNYSTSAVGSASYNYASTTQLAVSPNPAILGQTIMLTATVAGGSGQPTPTGTITFVSGSATLGTGTLNTAGVATYTTSTLLEGTYAMTAEYGGDSNFSASASIPVSETVNTFATTTQIAVSPNPANAGQTITLTATVTGVSGQPTPAGTVTFLNGIATLGSGTLNGAGVATFTTSTLAIGTYSLTAQYRGNSTYSTSTSTSVSETVNANPSTTLLSLSPNPAIAGQSVTLTAAVSVGSGQPTPTGTVTFLNGAAVLGAGTLNGSGVATYTTSTLSAGSYALSAQYNGNGNFSASSTTTTTETVSTVSSATQLTVSPNPSIAGQTITLTAVITGGGGGILPTGVVTFLNGSTILGTGTVISGVASYSTSSLAYGSYTLTAQYSGDGNFLASNSSPVSQTVQPATTTQLTVAPNPIALDQPLTLTATVAGGVPGVTPTGTVTFLNGAATLGAGTLNSSGVATFTTSSLPVGLYSLTAHYGGDDTYAISTSTAVATTVTMVVSTTQLAVSPSPATVGQPLTLTATVAGGSGQITPTGTITFLNGQVPIGSGSVTASGIVTFTTTLTAPGTYHLAAQYSGDSNFSGSSAAAVASVYTTAGTLPVVPTILFTDVQSGPATGGENGNGIYLTIFGYNFGASQGSSTVTVNGTPAAQYLAWGSAGVGNVEKIGVQIAAGTTTGPVVVTVGGNSSLSNPVFTVRTGKIWFIGSGTDNSSPTSNCTTTLSKGIDGVNPNSFTNPWGLTSNSAVPDVSGAETTYRTPFTYARCISPGDTLVFLDGVNYPYFDGRGWHASLTVNEVTTTATSFFTFMARPGATVQLGGDVAAYKGIVELSSGWNVFSGLGINGSLLGGDAFGPTYYDRIVGNTMTCATCDGAAGAFNLASGDVAYGNIITDVSTTVNGGQGSGKEFHAVYDEGNNTEFAWNRIYNTRAYNGVQLNQGGSGGPGYYNFSAHDNDIADVNGSCINLSTVDPVYGYINVYNNVLHHCGLNYSSDGGAGDPHSCLASKGYSTDTTGVGSVYISNNTMYDCSSILNTYPTESASCAFLVYPNQLNVTLHYVNNLVYQPNYAGTSAQNVYVCDGGSTIPSALLVGSNNIWYSATASGSLSCGTNASCVTGIGTIENPLYNNPADGPFTNYFLQPGSPAIGAGIAVSPVTAIGLSYPTLSWDFNGFLRPAAPSIGAYEPTDASSATSVQLAASPNPAAVAQPITVTATVVSGIPGTAPTGTVTFYSGATVLGTGTVNASGVATYTTASLPAGSYSLTAEYSGDSNFWASASITASETIVTDPTTTAIAINSPNPTTVGQPVMVTATVTTGGPSTAAPTGTVTFLNGATVLGSATVNASGVATFTTTLTTPGNYLIGAQYSGDINYSVSASGQVADSVETGGGALPAVPVILFTDIQSGPATGGENGNGVYLTLFGYNFGGSQGTSTVKINGTSVAQYLFWGSANVGNLEKISVQIAAGTTTGPIVVTAGGYTSINNPAFTVRAGKIWFIGPGVDNSSPGSTCSTILAKGIDGATANSYTNPWGLTNFASTNESLYNYSTMRTPYTYSHCISEGDTLVFLNGVNYPYYDGRGWHASFTVPGASTASSFLTIMARPGATVQLGSTGFAYKGIVDLSNGWTVVSGLGLTGDNGGTAYEPAAYDRLVGNYITCPDCDGESGAVNVGTGDVVYGNVITNVSTTVNNGQGAAKLFHAIYDEGSNTEVAWNRIYNTLSYNGIQLNQGGSGGPGYYNVSLHDNDISDVEGSCINLSTIDPVNGYINVYNNVLHHCGLQFAYGGGSGDPHSCLAMKGYSSDTSGAGTGYIYNNTMYDCSSVLNANPGESGSCAVLIYPSQLNVSYSFINNVAYQPSYAGTSSQNVFVCAGGSTVPSSQLTGSNNIWYSSTPSGSLACGTNTSCVTGIGTVENPMFSNPADGSFANYFLQPGSPAIGAGIPVGSVISTGIPYSTLSWDFNYDPRPNPPSIGAFEGGTTSSATTTLLSVSANPANIGLPLTLTATITGGLPQATPTGTVTFLNGATTLGIGVVNGSGGATFTTSSLPLGTYTLTAQYSGDSNFWPSTSSILSDTMITNPTTSQVAVSPNPATVGQSITVTARVSAASGPAGTTPTGTVTFLNGSTPLGTGTVNSSGVATYTTSLAAPGSYMVVAQYGGDGNYSASTSSAVMQTVNTTGGNSPTVPVIKFTDVQSGPATGGEGGNGIYLTIFGYNFGSSQGASTVTINGTPVAQYLAWESAGVGNLEKIGVQIAAGTTTGPIVVNVGGSSSVSNPTFTVRAGNIWFIGPGVDNSVPGSSCATILAKGIDGATPNSYSNPWGLTSNSSVPDSSGAQTTYRTPFTYASCISPGDTLVFLNGVNYTYFDGRGWHASLTANEVTTTATSFFTFMARPGATVQLGGTGYAFKGFVDLSSGWTVISGLGLNGSYNPSGGTAYQPSPYDRLVGNTITCPNCDGAAGAVNMTTGNVVYGNVISNVSVSANGGQGAGKLYHAVYDEGSNTEFAWNRISNTLSYNGFQLNQGGNGGPGYYNVSAHDNDIADVEGSCINLSTIDPAYGYIQVYNNVMHHCGLQLSYGGSSGDPHSCLAIKGYSTDTTGSGTAYIYNNTMYDCSSILNSNAAEPASCAVQIYPNQLNVSISYINNVAYQPTYAGTSVQNVYVCAGGSTVPSTQFTGSNNIWYSDTPSGSLACGSNTACVTGLGAIEDPLYENPVDGPFTNYYLQTGSPALAAGVAVGPIVSNGSSFSILSWDFNYASRPASPSIGAFELADTASAITPVTTTQLVVSPTPAPPGQPVLLTANVTGGSSGTTPTGSVTFLNGAVALGSATVNANGVATYQASSLGVGSYTLIAQYSGDSNFWPSSSAAVSVTLNTIATTTQLAVSPTPVAFGQPVTLTAAVTGGSGGVTPTGTVTFTNGAATLGSGAVNASGIATYSTSSLNVGSFTLTAQYSGDSNFSASASAAAAETVNPASTTTQLAASPNSVAFGQPVTLTATVTGGPLGTTPAGTITFLNGSAILGTAALNGLGIASFTATLEAPGTFAVTATYSGSSTLQQSTSSIKSLAVTAPNVTLSMTNTNLVYGGPGTNLIATVTGENGVVPTGTIQFFAGDTLLQSVSLQGNGTAYGYVGGLVLAAGTESLTAVYSGDGNNPSSVSVGVPVTIAPAPVTLSVSCWNASFSYGDNYSCTASASSNAGGATGNLSFVSDGSLTLVPLNSGTATFAVNLPSSGQHTMVVTYGAQGNFAAAGPQTETYTVTPARTQIQLTPSSWYAPNGQPLVLSATLTSSSAGAPAGGTVTYFDNGTTLGTAPVSLGVSTFTIASPVAGSHNYSAAFSATNNFSAASAQIYLSVF